MVFNWYLTKAPRSYYMLVHFITFTRRERSIHSLLAIFIDYSLYARSNQSILKEISPKYSLEGLMLKLKLQYFGHLMQKNWLIGKDPDAGKDWRWEEKGTTEDEMVGWHHRLNGHEFEQALGVGDGQGGLVCAAVLEVAKSWTRLSDWTELNWTELTERQTSMFWLQKLYSEPLCHAVSM